MNRLNGKIVILTGGTGFLGQSFAGAMLDEGATVVILDPAANPTGNTLRARNLRIDITDEGLVKKVVGGLGNEFGHIDALINNAAMNPVPGSQNSKKQFAPYEEYDLEMWKKEIDVGLTGAQICTQEVAKLMMKQKSGSIVNIGSHYGLIAPDNRIYAEGNFKSIAYATVKGALLNFTRAWAGYLGEHGVRVNCLVFGGVQNGQDAKFVKAYSRKTMLGRMARPGEYNEGLIFLASDSSSYMTGQTLVMDGGWTAM